MCVCVTGKSRVHTELVSAEDQHWLINLEPQCLGLDELDRLSVDLDEALALLAVSDSGGRL